MALKTTKITNRKKTFKWVLNPTPKHPASRPKSTPTTLTRNLFSLPGALNIKGGRLTLNPLSPTRTLTLNSFSLPGALNLRRGPPNHNHNAKFLSDARCPKPYRRQADTRPSNSNPNPKSLFLARRPKPQRRQVDTKTLNANKNDKVVISGYVSSYVRLITNLTKIQSEKTEKNNTCWHK